MIENLKIYRPLKGNFLSQGFGENKIPLYKKLGMKGHNGEDWVGYNGIPIYHSGDYKGISKNYIDNNGGVGIDIISKDKFGNNFIKLRYWHLQKSFVYDGQEVNMGQLIAYGDNTGLSTGAHLHFSLKECDAFGNAYNSDNGYFGAINHRPYFENVFVLDVLNIKEQALSAIQLANLVISKVAEFLKRIKK